MEFKPMRKFVRTLNKKLQPRNSAQEKPVEVLWSDPIRRRGKTPLSHIPVDVYIAIFDELQPSAAAGSAAEHKAPLAALCLVCRLFRVECQPRLFARVRFTAYAPHAEGPHTHHALWVALAKGRPRAAALAAVVRELAYARAPTFQDYAPCDLGAVVRGFGGLSSVVLSRCVVTPATFDALAGLQNVTKVVFEQCFVVSDFSLPTYAGADSTSAGTWTRLSVSVNPDAPRAFVNALARAVAVPRLTHLSTNLWPLTTTLFAGQSAPRLTELETTVKGHADAQILAVLQNCPNLVRLSVKGRMFHDDEGGRVHRRAGAPLPAHVVPRLEALSADYRDAERILPHHAVRELDVAPVLDAGADGDDAGEQAAALVFAPGEFKAYVALLNAAPHDLGALETAVMRPGCAHAVGAANMLLGDGLAFITAHPGVTTVLWVAHPTGEMCTACAEAALTLPTQRAVLLPALAKAFPNARVFRMCGVIEWRRAPLGASAGAEAGMAEWVPRVCDAQRVQRLLVREDVEHVQDVGGCLAAVLTPQIRARFGKDFAFTRYGGMMMLP